MKNQDIVCISMTNWEGDFMKTIVHMMSHLSKNHRVLFVNYPFTYKDLVMTALGKAKAPWRKMLGVEDRIKTVLTSFGTAYHMTLPPVFPTNWIKNEHTYKRMIKRQSRVVQDSVLNAMDRLGFHNPVVINALNPLMGLPLVGKFNESKLIYYCYDEIRAAEWCGKHGGMMEDEFIPMVDEVVVTSEGLLQSKKQKNQNVTLVKNGVDFELFNKAYDGKRFHKKKKTIGYVGSIDFRLNYDLLEQLIAERPDYDFHFVGRINDQKGKERLSTFQNVTFFGGKQPHEIPELMRTFDLGIIPFAKNEFTRNVYPLKINEYLAAGLPVITTDFASLVDFKAHISIAKTTCEFLVLLDKELKADNSKKAEKRIEVGLQNDWSGRAQMMESIIGKELVHA